MFSQVGERNFPLLELSGKKASLKERREERPCETQAQKNIIPATGFWAYYKPRAASPAPGDGITERGMDGLRRCTGK